MRPSSNPASALLAGALCFYLVACGGGTNGEARATTDGDDAVGSISDGAPAAAPDASGDTSTTRPPIDAPSGATPRSDDGAPTADAHAGVSDEARLAGFVDEVAGAICDALYRCCSQEDRDLWFEGYLFAERMDPYRGTLPPLADVDAAGCPSALAPALGEAPFGAWVSAAQRGLVGFHADELDRCLAELDGAACGEPVDIALGDGTCLDVTPPSNGRQRAIFSRDAAIGDPCATLSDGVGATFYGTCDPATSFCCYDRGPEVPGCGLPVDGAEGQCAAAAQRGEACGVFPVVQLCTTGHFCGIDPDVCEREAAADNPLTLGEICGGENFSLLGYCTEGWCDVGGTNRCEPHRALGEACVYPYECASSTCRDGRCAVWSFCTGGETPTVADPDAAGGHGADTTGTPDAGGGQPAPPQDAGTTDPGQARARGAESCVDAPDLREASVHLTDHPALEFRVAGRMGELDDYNPWNGSGKDPGCSMVYDAKGGDLVYSLPLQPGQTLTLRLTADQRRAPPAVYLLDSCPEASAPDLDGNGLCGSDVYATQGHCPVNDCDPLDWSFHWPTTLDGEPTAPKTFYLVVDEVGGQSIETFTLDWAVRTP